MATLESIGKPHRDEELAMRWINHLVSLFRRGRMEQSLDEELRYHIEEKTQALIAAMDDVIAKSAAPERFRTLLLGLFALLALALAGIGIYGVMSYSVSQRTHEIGVRMALGAQRRDVLRLVVWRGMALAIAGIVIGLGGALALTRFLASMLYGIGAVDPLTFAALSLLLAVVAFVACYIPARRATKVDPVIALRCE